MMGDARRRRHDGRPSLRSTPDSVLIPNAPDSTDGGGLRPGDLVIVSNLGMLYDGVAVRPAGDNRAGRKTEAPALDLEP